MIITERLTLRPWAAADLEPFARINADPRVAAWLAGPLDRAASDGLAARISDGLAQRGWGLWAVEVQGGAGFIGFVGLNPPSWAPPEADLVELAWRLDPAAWGRGYATEAARAALEVAFGPAGLRALVAVTATGNVRSRAVMTRLGMVHDPAADFDHPLLDVDHPLRQHVLYRIKAP